MSIDLAVSDHVARVTINRPERLNAIDESHQKDLRGVWEAIEADRSVRVVVLTGAGDRAFCAGDDMRAEGATGLDYWLHARHSTGESCRWRGSSPPSGPWKSC